MRQADSAGSGIGCVVGDSASSKCTAMTENMVNKARRLSREKWLKQAACGFFAAGHRMRR